MIRLEPAEGRRLREFLRFPASVYRDLPCHRATEEDVAEMLLERKTCFFEHARMAPFLALDGERTVARVALLQDSKRPEYVQLAFFEALPEARGVAELALSKARQLFAGATTAVAGLNAHLNYSAGFLADRFDEPPVFGLPYTPPYYLDCFPGWLRRDMVSFRFDAAPFYERRRAAPPISVEGLRLRAMDPRRLAREVELYTALNNACFQEHPYWADRTPREDLELFAPFRFLLHDDNLIFAERDGVPVGFLLWYPDFNELAAHGERLGLKHFARFKLLGRRPRTFRLTEIAVVEPHKNRAVAAAMLVKLAELAEKHGFAHGEGGFIFQDNPRCLAMTTRAIEQALGHRPEPYRRYCVFEVAL